MTFQQRLGLDSTSAMYFSNLLSRSVGGLDRVLAKVFRDESEELALAEESELVSFENVFSVRSLF